MILNRLKVSNFRQVCGLFELKFAPPGDTPVTVVLGDNGSGKTTMLEALFWCLYGHLRMENPEELISHRVVERGALGEVISAFVEVRFTHMDSTYTVMRSVDATKADGGDLSFAGSPELRVDVLDRSGGTTTALEPQRLVSQLLPEGLARYFFFRGEDLEGFAQRSASERLKEAVETFVDLKIVDRGIHHLAQVNNEFEKRLRQISSGEGAELEQSIVKSVQDHQDEEAQLTRARSELTALEQRHEELNGAMEAAEMLRPLMEDLRAAKAGLENEEAKERDGLVRLNSTISRHAFLAPLSDVFETTTALAEKAIKQGDLPANIKPQFVTQLIDDGTCICGKSIDAAMGGALEHWRSEVGLGDLESAVSALQAQVVNYKTQREEFLQNLDADRATLAQITASIDLYARKKSAAEAEIRGRKLDEGDAARLRLNWTETGDEIIDVRTVIARVKERLETTALRLADLRKQRKQLSQATKEAANVVKHLDAAGNIREALTRLRAGWVGLVQGYVDRLLKSAWDEIAQLPRLVAFDEEFHLSIRERGGDGNMVLSAPSTANRRALALCFVSSLISLAGQIKEAQGSGGLGGVFLGGDYPLVMDAPFASMDHFRETVPRGLKSRVPQLVIFTSHDQWDGRVATALEKSVGRAYVLELFTPEKVSRAVPFLGQDVSYISHEADSAFDWTEVQEVTR